MTKVAIVILNWNGADMMRRFLPGVIANSPEARVFVADNASSDGSLEMLSANFPTVSQIVLDRNYGFADGYNQALRQVEAEYYVLLNSDVETPHQWLAPLLQYMEAHPDVAACQPILRCQWNKEYFEYAGAAGGYLDSLGYPYCRGRLMATVEKDYGQYNTIAPLMWATGACMMIRSQDYWQAGGLDGRFFAHQEEIDLCWRL
ncbi:MAG: glycosyltransferase family 2 protein, partial [Bacteroidaceae bacterium]|nr:glycosyltransferase family 2 protein [Bacteroidaceae bacterium]